VAEELGLGGEFVFNEIIAYSGSYDGGDTDFELAWSGVGQHTDIMTPMHMCLITCAVANGGVAMEPKLLYETASPGEGARGALASEAYKTLLKGNEADFLKKCMRLTVEDGTG